MYSNPKRFFAIILLVTLVTLLNIVLLVILSGGGETGLIVALIFTIINAFLLLAVLIASIINLVRYISHEERANVGIHIMNFVFSFLVTCFFGFFYIVIILGAMITILPFL